MTAPLSPSLLVLLSLPPLLWAGNAVVGAVLAPAVSPVLLNALRWAVALAVLLPFTRGLWRGRERVYRNWRWFVVTGFLGMGLYNALLYRALHTSSPLNVTLISSGLPVFMLIVGALGFQAPVQRRQAVGALLSLAGVLTVLSQGQWQRLLAIEFVQGDVLMLLANVAWAVYSWLLTRAPSEVQQWHWADRLGAQVLVGVVLAGLSTVGEAAWGALHFDASPSTWLGLLYIAIGPSLLAYRCWGLGVERGGPAMAAFFYNLTPLITALLGLALMSAAPQTFHMFAFLLIASGIWVSSNR
ncbi:DMT family transporter [Inhella gelatinilytica]|uniref:DMT family transporter n=1 Tax=Inhella gelatinilytica TaxID=2795030 RepID=A0A931ND88_9BURK|nr:DMT family transporter [Inhella gelatinilytica]MBH9552827.1 DMT family transporter [Inhella gelatinilytica]